jgi:hypothetical protein
LPHKTPLTYLRRFPYRPFNLKFSLTHRASFAHFFYCSHYQCVIVTDSSVR